MQANIKDQDIHLIEQLRIGSKEAFRILFDTFGPKIHHFAFSYLKNKDDADELLQEVFLKLWELRTKLDDTKNIKSFLFKICINLIYDFIRRKNIEKAFIQYSGTQQSYSDDTWSEIVYNDMLYNLNRLIDGMPEQRQLIFRLSKEQGLTNEEIALKLNLSRRTIENQLYRAVLFLKTKLGTGSFQACLLLLLFCD
jgi:RNA polymerase sigma-70 factor (family 1)